MAHHAHMADVRAHGERRIDVAAHHIYRVLADFNSLHPRILPAAFSAFRVETGGVGAGTVIAYRLRVGGRSREARARVDEPEPGRVLTETDLARSLVTTFTVDPDGDGCRVQIDTHWRDAGGVGGWLERTFAPRVLGRLYADELDRLETVASEVAALAIAPEVTESL